MAALVLDPEQWDRTLVINGPGYSNATPRMGIVAELVREAVLDHGSRIPDSGLENNT